MKVLRVDESRGLALCADAEERRESVEIALVEPISPGDELLVHAGTAIGRAEPDRLREAGGREFPSERGSGRPAERLREAGGREFPSERGSGRPAEVTT
jgi:hydrogenase maturation factor